MFRIPPGKIQAWGLIKERVKYRQGEGRRKNGRKKEIISFIPIYQQPKSDCQPSNIRHVVFPPCTAKQTTETLQTSWIHYLQVGRPNPQLLIWKLSSNTSASVPEGFSSAGKSATTKHDKVLFTNPSRLSCPSPRV